MKKPIANRLVPLKHGFALPSVFIASIVMISVLVVTMAAVVSVRNSLKDQKYTQLAQLASEAGQAYAKACMASNGNFPKWSDAKPLKPNTTCDGTESVSCTDSSTSASCFVTIDGNVKTTFSVPYPIASNGSDYRVNATGTTKLVRSSTGIVWKTYPSTSSMAATINSAPTITTPYSGYDLLFCRYTADCSGISGISSDFSYQVAFTAKAGSKYAVDIFNVDARSTSWTTGTEIINNITYATPTSGATLSGNVITATNAGETRVTFTGTGPRDKTVFVRLTEVNSAGSVISPSSYTSALGVYTTVGSYSLSSPASASIQYLVVAGGGGGGARFGGAGAGGYITGTTTVTGGTQFSPFVGAGGAGGSSLSSGNSGNNSQLLTFTAVGGGGGGGTATAPSQKTGKNGGSGGGGSGDGATSGSSISGGTGTSGQGFAGGNGYEWPSNNGGGGGGGAGAAGASVAAQNAAGAGGIGVANTISGASKYYAGGGGGAGQAGAIGAGGNGGGGTRNVSSGNGTANTGGGGAAGGDVSAGGAGGSGIVILRSPKPAIVDIPTDPVISDILFCRYSADCSGVSGISADLSYQIAFTAKASTKYKVQMFTIDGTSASWTTGSEITTNITYASPTSGATLSSNVITTTNAGETRVTFTGTGPRDKTVFVQLTEVDGSGNALSSPNYTKALGVYITAGSYTLSSPSSASVQYLVVAGGGGGGYRFGGAGAGGYLTGTTTVSAGTQFNPIVGAGGAGGVSTSSGANGSNSQLLTFTAIGGGGGGGSGTSPSQKTGKNGGSGGGGTGDGATSGTSISGGSGTSGQGFAGGNGYEWPSNNGGGGGGGAGAAGVSAAAQNAAGGGGAGAANIISGLLIFYAGGGGGGGQAGAIGSGGTGGGGTRNVSSGNGTANTGGGGAAGADVANGGTGGSGIVIFRLL